MMKSRASLLMLAALTCAYPIAAIDLPPNRGKFLTLVVESGGKISLGVGMEVSSKWITQSWNVHDPTYDFIFAVVNRSDFGCKVSFTRYVMKYDYLPREEHLEAEFPYSQQARYPFFDYGYVIGFYRNSWEDIDHRKLVFPQSSNHAIERTADRRTLHI
jgi:hypothetical protein